MISSPDDLSKHYPNPSDRAIRKDIGHIDRHARHFIQNSPFCVISTSDIHYNQDASPRGGEIGFVKVLDHHTLLIPDSRGNNRLDSLKNIVVTGHIGLLFMIPGLNDTLRINGNATVSTSSEHLDRFAADSFPARSAIVVSVKECFLHCAKAFMRSKLWEDESRIDKDQFPSLGEMLKDQLGSKGKAETRKESEQRYSNEL